MTEIEQFVDNGRCSGECLVANRVHTDVDFALHEWSAHTPKIIHREYRIREYSRIAQPLIGLHMVE
jgi:hypothetical protein